jgi:hypothetical protein
MASSFASGFGRPDYAAERLLLPRLRKPKRGRGLITTDEQSAVPISLALLIRYLPAVCPMFRVASRERETRGTEEKRETGVRSRRID